MPQVKTTTAIFELIIAALFWGFGFVAVVWALEAMTASEITWMRFAIAFAIGLPLVLIGGMKHWRETLTLSFWPAVCLIGTLFFQSWGLKYTTATKSGFITTLYVVFVPILESVLLKRGLPLGLWLCVAGALIGTILIVDLGFSTINVGDLLTFVCALFATAQIYSLGLISPRVRQPFFFNITQSLWGTVLLLPLVLNSKFWTQPELLIEAPIKVWVGMFSLAIGSTVIAFYLQVRAQAKLSPTVSSLLFLLESPFAMLLSIYFLGESLGFLESVGAALIFASAAAASMLETRWRSV